jgi:type II secretion system (T2SS) protein F
MALTKQQLEEWARDNGHNPDEFWPVTREELKAWARDFCQELDNPERLSFCARLERTIPGQPNGYLRHALAAVSKVMALGFPLSKAMSLDPDIFDETFLAVVRYGELYGELSLTLRRLVDHPEDQSPRCSVERRQ